MGDDRDDYAVTKTERLGRATSITGKSSYSRLPPARRPAAPFDQIPSELLDRLKESASQKKWGRSIVSSQHALNEPMEEGSNIPKYQKEVHNIKNIVHFTEMLEKIGGEKIDIAWRDLYQLKYKPVIDGTHAITGYVQSTQGSIYHIVIDGEQSQLKRVAPPTNDFPQVTQAVLSPETGRLEITWNKAPGNVFVIKLSYWCIKDDPQVKVGPKPSVSVWEYDGASFAVDRLSPARVQEIAKQKFGPIIDIEKLKFLGEVNLGVGAPPPA